MRIKELQELIEANKVDHLFIDLDREDSDMISLIQKISIANKTLFIIISSSDNAMIAFKTQQAGARAFISKNSGKKEISDCLNTIHADNYYLSPDVFNNALESHLDGKKDIFTERELEILNFIASGKNIKDISALLNLSRYTVIAHRRNMMKKLGVNNMMSLVKRAKEIGQL